MRNKLSTFGILLIFASVISMVIQVRFLDEVSKIFAFSFFVTSIGSAMNIPKAYNELKNDRRNALQIRKYFVGSILSTIVNFVIFIIALIWL